MKHKRTIFLIIFFACFPLVSAFAVVYRAHTGTIQTHPPAASKKRTIIIPKRKRFAT
jgi:hypothetical protein